MNKPNEPAEGYLNQEAAENSKILLSNKDISNYDSSSKKKVPNREDNGSKEKTENYRTKQKELSSWYYIKSNPKPKVMSIYDETKSKLSSRHNFSSTSLQKFRSIDDLIQRQNKSVIQNDTLNYNSKEQLYHGSMTPDIDIKSEDYIQSLREAATKLKNQQINVSLSLFLP